jgi:hypothetical protein
MQKILPDVSFLTQWRDKIEAVGGALCLDAPGTFHP